MIVCHQHRFIFIKTRKTAGSSVEIALSRLCSEGDIVTRLSEERGEEALRRKEGGYGPTGHFKLPRDHRGFKEWRRLLTRGQRAAYAPHMRAPEIRELVGPEVWNEYLKITIERNPWDHALSRYWWQKQRWKERGRTGFPGISEYLDWLEANKPHWLSNWSHYTINDHLAVDYVLFYENLEEELADVSRYLGVSEDTLCLPKIQAKGGMRKDKRPYQDVLSKHDCDLVARVCSKEIEAFGYRYTE